ncbi:hypothetical protein [Streptomyces sp. NPDC055109]
MIAIERRLTLGRGARVAGRDCHLDPDGRVASATATLIRAISARDTAIGTAMVLATNPQALRAISVCRTAGGLVRRRHLRQRTHR